MGYTHAWNLSEKPTDTEFAVFRGRVNTILGHLRVHHNLELVYEADCPRTPPLVSLDFIRFNGIGAEGHETFVLENRDHRGMCKTAEKPYDLAVCCVLLIAEALLPGFTFESDGLALSDDPDDADEYIDAGWVEAMRVITEEAFPDWRLGNLNTKFNKIGRTS